MSLIWPPAESSPAFRKTRKASLEAIVENTPPSEDGEALQRSVFEDVQLVSPVAEVSADQAVVDAYLGDQVALAAAGRVESAS